VLWLVVVASLVLVVAIQQVLGMLPQVVHALPGGASGALSWKVAHAWAWALEAFQVHVHSLPQGVVSQEPLTAVVPGLLALTLEVAYQS
jgi:hypothetical protein